MKRKLVGWVGLFWLAGYAWGAGEDQSPLTPQARVQLEAFAELAHQVRFFHPSDQSAGCDWNHFLTTAFAPANGLEQPATTPAELAQRLETLLRPVAPTLRVQPEGLRPDAVAELQPAAEDGANGANGADRARVLRWRHYGVGLPGSTKLYTSARIDNLTAPGFGQLAQALPAAPWRGRQVRFEARWQAELAAGEVRAFLRVDGPGGKVAFLDAMADRPLRTSTGWVEVELAAPVPENAETIVVGVVFAGAGTVRLDSAQLLPAAAPLVNGDFDEGEEGRQPPGWNVPYDSIRAGYRVELQRGAACDGGRAGEAPESAGTCVAMLAGPIATPAFPPPGEALELKLGAAGVTAWVPLTLYSGPQGTVPVAESPAACQPAAVSVRPVPRAERLAAVTTAWGLLAHFHPQLAWDDGRVFWRKQIGHALEAAATAGDDEELLRVLRRLVAGAGDASASVSRADLRPTHTLPLQWAFLGSELVVTAVFPGAPAEIRPGDVVAELDGVSVEDRFAADRTLFGATNRATERGLVAEYWLLGGEQSTVRVTRTRQGSSPRTLDLRRNADPAQVFAPRAPALRPLADGALYVNLALLEPAVLERESSRLARAAALVLDAREGLAASPQELLAHLTDHEVPSSQFKIPVQLAPGGRDLQYLTTQWTAQPKAPRWSRRVAILQDERCLGVTETLLASVAYAKLAVLVGSRSAGTNGDLNRALLPGGFQLRWMGMRVNIPTGGALHNGGIEPDIEAQPTPAGLAAGRDEVLEAALRALG